MSEQRSIVKRYFRSVEVWAWCDICREMIRLKVDKQEIQDNLELGIYTKEYMHTNPFPDPDDPDDNSTEEHTIYVYIDDQYNVTGVKSFFGDSPTIKAVGAEEQEEGKEVRIPIVVKDVPQMSVHLGMITQEQYKVLKICDGMNTLEQVAEIANKSVEKIEDMMDQLRDKGLVKVIRRK